MAVTTTTFAEDFKKLYGTVQEQVNTRAALMNLFRGGEKFGQPFKNVGGAGYTFLARLNRNWNMGFRPEGITGVGQAGNIGMKQATVYLKYAYVPQLITGQAENLSKGSEKAFVQAKAMELKYDTKDIVSHVDTIFGASQPGGALAVVASGSAGTFTADTAAGLPGALFLQVGMPISIGPTGGGAASVASATITDINYSTGVVTHDGGTATTGHGVYVIKENSLTAGERTVCDGLTSIVSDTGAVAGLDPSQAGQQNWRSYVHDAVNTDLSVAALQKLRQFVSNRSGVEPDVFLFSPAQIARYVNLATADLRFVTSNDKDIGKRALDLGFTTYGFSKIPVIEAKNLLPDHVYCGNSGMLKKFEAVPLQLADDEAGAWTRMFGADGITDAVGALMRWYLQFAPLQRNAWGCIKGLTVDSEFMTNPFSL